MATAGAPAAGTPAPTVGPPTPAATLTAGPSPSVAGSPLATAGKNFSLVMHSAGVFPYHRSLHPWMKAAITVAE